MSQTTTAESGASQAKEKVQEGADRAREGLRGQVDQRSTQAGQRVRSQSEDIRSVAQQLREQGKEGPAKLAEQAADRTQRVGSWLEQSSGDDIISDVEDLARRNPWAVALGGLALGFTASRLLRASSSDRYHRSGNGHARLPAPRSTPVATTPQAAGPSPTGL